MVKQQLYFEVFVCVIFALLSLGYRGRGWGRNGEELKRGSRQLCPFICVLGGRHEGQCPHFCRREGEKRLSEHIKELKKQLTARDQMIQRLQVDLKAKEKVSGFIYSY